MSLLDRIVPGSRRQYDGAEYPIRLNGRMYRVTTQEVSPLDWKKFAATVTMPEVLRPMREILQPGDAFIDVGAYVGDTLLYAHSLVGPDGFLWAFEPDPALYKALRSNLDANGIANVCAENAAVGATSGSLPRVEVLGQVRSEFKAKTEEDGTIQVVALDSYIEHLDIEPNLIKVDVDGAEFDVLRGAGNIVIGRIPLILELHERRLLREWEATVDFILEKAREVRYLGAQGRAPSAHPYGTILTRSDELDSRVTSNLLIL